MPIRKEDRKFYGSPWRALSRRIRFGRAGGRCERCGAIHGWLHPQSGKLVALTVHHFNFTPGDDREENLIAVCQACHLELERPRHTASARITRQRRKDAQRPLLLLQM
ncbi:MAG TPA: HNH endonuclease signature motif containing protein [Blastocatellia bacterium]|nr:HNH endonuclease signature motif containing protein [Blastocatellia bacterium]